jgi:hypothetical protein
MSASADLLVDWWWCRNQMHAPVLAQRDVALEIEWEAINKSLFGSLDWQLWFGS